MKLVLRKSSFDFYNVISICLEEPLRTVLNSSNFTNLKCRLEDIFYKYGVDIVLQAHEHSYERLWPQYKGVVLSKNYTNPQAPVQLISGAAGSKYKRDPEKAQRGNC